MRLTLPYTLWLVFSYLALRIFANEGERRLHAVSHFPPFCIQKSICCPVAAFSSSHIPVEETTFMILPVHFQEHTALKPILRDKYLFGAILFIYLLLFFFLDHWEQTKSSFPCWEEMVGLLSKFPVQKKF